MGNRAAMYYVEYMRADLIEDVWRNPPRPRCPLAIKMAEAEACACKGKCPCHKLYPAQK